MSLNITAFSEERFINKNQSHKYLKTKTIQYAVVNCQGSGLNGKVGKGVAAKH